MTFESRNADDLESKTEAMFGHKFDYSAIAEASLKRYDAEAYYHEMMKIYK